MTLSDPYREDPHREDPYREWDGAYVMGSLSPSERREYEQHLSCCAHCAGEVAALAGISGILSTVPPEQALALLPDGSAAGGGGASGGSFGGALDRAFDGASDGASDGGVVRRLGDDVPPPSLLPTLLAAGRAARRRTRLRVTALVAAAAVVAAAVALAVPLLLAGPSETVASGQLVSLSQAVPSPITAEATLFAEPWGTRIQVVCWYARDTSADDAPVRTFRYALHVTDRSGADTQVASWNASAGSRSTPVATTNLPRDQIGTIDIRMADTGLVLLEAHP